jgi:hypothetical protein
MVTNLITIFAILVPMILGFFGVILSMHNMVNNAVKTSSDSTYHRIGDFRADVDRRFDEQKADTNQRFDAVNKRLDEQKADLNLKFDSVNKRLDEQKADMNLRFDGIDKRFDGIDKRLDEQKAEISIVSNRLNTYIDSFAVRLMTGSHAKVTKKKATAKV